MYTLLKQFWQDIRWHLAWLVGWLTFVVVFIVGPQLRYLNQAPHLTEYDATSHQARIPKWYHLCAITRRSAKDNDLDSKLTPSINQIDIDGQGRLWCVKNQGELDCIDPLTVVSTQGPLNPADELLRQLESSLQNYCRGELSCEVTDVGLNCLRHVKHAEGRESVFVAGQYKSKMGGVDHYFVLHSNSASQPVVQSSADSQPLPEIMAFSSVPQDCLNCPLEDGGVIYAVGHQHSTANSALGHLTRSTYQKNSWKWEQVPLTWNAGSSENPKTSIYSAVTLPEMTESASNASKTHCLILACDAGLLRSRGLDGTENEIAMECPKYGEGKFSVVKYLKDNVGLAAGHEKLLLLGAGGEVRHDLSDQLIKGTFISNLHMQAQAGAAWHAYLVGYRMEGTKSIPVIWHVEASPESDIPTITQEKLVDSPKSFEIHCVTYCAGQWFFGSKKISSRSPSPQGSLSNDSYTLWTLENRLMDDLLALVPDQAEGNRLLAISNDFQLTGLTQKGQLHELLPFKRAESTPEGGDKWVALTAAPLQESRDWLALNTKGMIHPVVWDGGRPYFKAWDEWLPALSNKGFQFPAIENPQDFQRACREKKLHLAAWGNKYQLFLAVWNDQLGVLGLILNGKSPAPKWIRLAEPGKDCLVMPRRGSDVSQGVWVLSRDGCKLWQIHSAPGAPEITFSSTQLDSLLGDGSEVFPIHHEEHNGIGKITRAAPSAPWQFQWLIPKEGTSEQKTPITLTGFETKTPIQVITSSQGFYIKGDETSLWLKKADLETSSDKLPFTMRRVQKENNTLAVTSHEGRPTVIMSDGSGMNDNGIVPSQVTLRAQPGRIVMHGIALVLLLYYLWQCWRHLKRPPLIVTDRFVEAPKSLMELLAIDQAKKKKHGPQQGTNSVKALIELLKLLLSGQVAPPLVIALNAKAGSGKTTFTQALSGYLRGRGWPVVLLNVWHDCTEKTDVLQSLVMKIRRDFPPSMRTQPLRWLSFNSMLMADRLMGMRLRNLDAPRIIYIFLLVCWGLDSSNILTSETVPFAKPLLDIVEAISKSIGGDWNTGWLVILLTILFLDALDMLQLLPHKSLGLEFLKLPSDEVRYRHKLALSLESINRAARWSGIGRGLIILEDLERESPEVIKETLEVLNFIKQELRPYIIVNGDWEVIFKKLMELPLSNGNAPSSLIDHRERMEGLLLKTVTTYLPVPELSSSTVDFNELADPWQRQVGDTCWNRFRLLVDYTWFQATGMRLISKELREEVLPLNAHSPSPTLQTINTSNVPSGGFRVGASFLETFMFVFRQVMRFFVFVGIALKILLQSIFKTLHWLAAKVSVGCGIVHAVICRIRAGRTIFAAALSWLLLLLAVVIVSLVFSLLDFAPGFYPIRILHWIAEYLKEVGFIAALLTDVQPDYLLMLYPGLPVPDISYFVFPFSPPLLALAFVASFLVWAFVASLMAFLWRKIIIHPSTSNSTNNSPRENTNVMINEMFQKVRDACQ